MLRGLRSHKFYVPLVTVAVSAGLFLVYYFFYVNWQRNDANERAFRLLTVVDDQLVNRYENLRNVFGAALADAHPEQYLARFVEGESSDIRKPTCPVVNKRQGELILALLPSPGHGFALRATFQPAENSANCCTLAATLDLSAELRERFHNVTQDYFDDILIATSSGEVLFQKNLTGLRVTNLEALFPRPAAAANEKKPQEAERPGKQNGLFETAAEFTNVKDVELAGTRYKLYIQPAPVVIGAVNRSEKLRLVVCGLWRSDRLQSEVVSIPYSVLIWGALVLLAAFAMLWPLLKVAYMSPAERLRRRHVFYLLSSALLVTTVLTVIVLNASYAMRNGEESREQLEYLANRIDTNLRTELWRALSFMEQIGQQEALYQKFHARTAANWAEANYYDPAARYPYFDNVSWVDEEGQQQFKISAQAHATPAIGVHDKAYFQDILHQRDLSDAGALVPCPGCGANGAGKLIEPRFRLDSVYSRNTGEFLVVLARPYRAPAAWQDIPECLRHLQAQVMVGKFLSLVNPVVPPGFGFALVNHEGVAQFHSIAARSGIEDFFKECRQNPALKALVLNGGSDHVSADYMGKRQQMFVRPLPYLAGNAPVLVVFRDTNYFNTINVACLLVFALLAGMFSVPFLIGLALAVLTPENYPLERLWPSRESLPKYVDLTIANLCLTAAFVWRVPDMRMDQTLLGIAGMVLVAALLCVQPRRAGARWEGLTKLAVLGTIVTIAGWSPALSLAVLYGLAALPGVSARVHRLAGRRFTLRYAYLGMVLSLLAILVVLPSFGLFRISYNTINRLALQTAQLARHDQMQHRAAEIRERYQDLPAAAALITARLNELLDRYDNAVYYPKDGDTASRFGAPDVSWLERPIAWSAGFFPANRFGAELRESALATHPGRDVRWEAAQDGDDEILQMFAGDAASPKLAGVYPLWQMPGRALLLLAPLSALLAIWLLYLIRKVFLTEMEDLPQLETWAREKVEGRNLLIIGDSASGAEVLPAAPEADVVDLEQIAGESGWMLPALAAPVTRLDHFEFDLDNPDTSQRKLEILEKLRREGKQLILVSAVDPMFRLAGADAGALSRNGFVSAPGVELLDRWVRVFQGFEKLELRDVTAQSFDQILASQRKGVHCELIQRIEEECRYSAPLRKIGLGMLLAFRQQPRLSKAQFLEALLERAESHYGALLAACTRDERLVLYQLALDGWVNPKNERAIRRLQQRGLVRRGSGYRLMNDSLALFVRRVERPEEVARWDQEQEHSAWSAMKLALGTGLMMFGAWLLYAQQDVFQLGIGYLTALGTAGGAVLTLARTLRGKGGPEA